MGSWFSATTRSLYTITTRPRAQEASGPRVWLCSAVGKEPRDEPRGTRRGVVVALTPFPIQGTLANTQVVLPSMGRSSAALAARQPVFFPLTSPRPLSLGKVPAAALSPHSLGPAGPAGPDQSVSSVPPAPPHLHKPAAVLANSPPGSHRGATPTQAAKHCAPGYTRLEDGHWDLRVRKEGGTGHRRW